MKDEEGGEREGRGRRRDDGMKTRMEGGTEGGLGVSTMEESQSEGRRE